MYTSFQITIEKEGLFLLNIKNYLIFILECNLFYLDSMHYSRLH